ncbi:hypothetical protein BXT86_06375 [candidate division WOR-3 bacterium 4484_100]|uniref:Uncharacterized protein n=1 Tax=candidate division WOR-3 bacterium 4484_100 TaxID=1936077 RepID=A0A1V4QE17_UNCW3|nr:MAG: hypothetical protein BXT86_06375 [candidate division WOR-3 bacterium 4484_100]
MKIVVPFFCGGPVDISKFKEYISPDYPESSFEIIHNHLTLKVQLVQGKFLDRNFTIEAYISSSGISLIIVELNIWSEKSYEELEKLFLKNFKFQIGDKVITTSLYGFLIEFFLKIFKLKTLEEAGDLISFSRVKEDVVKNSGINFLFLGKEQLFVGFDLPYIISRQPKIPAGCSEIEIDQDRISVHKGRIFYLRTERIEKKLLFFILVLSFYKKYAGFTAGWMDDLKKDLTGLRTGIGTERAIEWEWEEKILETKRVNFLEVIASFGYVESLYSALDIPEKLNEACRLQRYKEQIDKNINSIEFIIGDIGKIIENRQSRLLTSATRRLEYLLTVLGSIGGVATIIAVFFSSNIPVNLKLISILAVLLIPTGIVLFEYIIRKRLKQRSRIAYVTSRIKNLLKEKSDFEKTVKALKAEKEIYGDETGMNIIKFYEKLIKQKEYEIERFLNQKR